MARVNVEGISVSVRLNGGTEDGKTVIKTSSLGAKLSPTSYDDDKAITIATLLEDCLAYPIYDIQKNVKSTISADE